MAGRLTDLVVRLVQVTIEMASGEWVLKLPGVRNGGPVIVLRSAFTASLLFVFGIVLRDLIQPGKSLDLDWHYICSTVARHPNFGGTLFAGIYLALYARFASQWSYLAGVYNEIKRAEVAGPKDLEALAEWKAGFMEDAEEVELATKPMFAWIIYHWGKEKKVAEHFKKNAWGEGRAI